MNDIMAKVAILEPSLMYSISARVATNHFKFHIDVARHELFSIKKYCGPFVVTTNVEDYRRLSTPSEMNDKGRNDG